MIGHVTEVKIKSRFFEGGNVTSIAATLLAAIFCILFYQRVVSFISPLNIKIDDVYIYVFSLFAIEFGALLTLFALFACKPTPFLERIKNTQVFGAIMKTTKITMGVATVAIAVTFIFGIIRLEPEHTLTTHSVLFLGWAALAAIATSFFVRTVRLIFAALT